MEEANATVDDLRLYGVFNLPHIDQVYLMFRGQLRDGSASAGHESLEVDLFSEAAIPWQEIAFPVVRETLTLFLDERRHGNFRVHMADVMRDPKDNTVRVVRFPA